METEERGGDRVWGKLWARERETGEGTKRKRDLRDEVSRVAAKRRV